MEDMVRAFDLNIERVLEDWTVVHALREVIANALDESALTDTAEPDIFEDEEGWHVRDGGRGLEYEHLTQNESAEKHDHPDLVIGKFGVGLKDALATLDRQRVRVVIRSRHADITTSMKAKSGFGDVKTLHAMIAPPSDTTLVGTDFVLSGSAVAEPIVSAAKALFLQFSDVEVIGSTRYGQVLLANDGQSRIFVNGLQVAIDEGFLFSYNITSSTKALRQALNRERSNVGRSAYTARVKDILKACDDPAVIDALVEDLTGFARGTQHDETRWKDIGLHACKALNASRKVIFVTAVQLESAKEFIQRARDDGNEIVVVPEDIARDLPGLTDTDGNPIRDLDEYRRDWQDSFKFNFVQPEDLTPNERAVWDALPRIFEVRGGQPGQITAVKISETMRLEALGYREAVGLWDPSDRTIVIKRDQLGSLKSFAGTILHEVAHAVSGAPDVSIEFEQALTDELGSVTSDGVRSRA